MTTETPQVQDEVLARLDRMERLLADLVGQRAVKDFYSVEEFAEGAGLRPYTVREHCRLGRLHADKRACGRGRSKEWMLSHAELTRFRNEGLLPLPSPLARSAG